MWLAGLTAGCLALASGANSRAETQEPTRFRIPIATLTDPSSTQVVEIESRLATAVASAGQFGVQQMAGFGAGWGGDAQLFWGAPGPSGDGPRLTVRFELPRAGSYDLVLFHTVAPDFGRFTIFLDGSPSSDVDGYHSSVVLSRSVLGRHELAAGGHELAFRVVGKNASSSGFFVGLDRLELTPAAAGEQAKAPIVSAPPRRMAGPPDGSRVAPPTPAPERQITILPGLIEVLASRPRLEARHDGMKCCPFRIETDFDTRRVVLDWSSPTLKVPFRWRAEGGALAQGRWEIYETAPLEWSLADRPLATGLVELPAPGEWQRFDVDLAPLTPATGPKLPLGGKMFSARALRPELFLRIVPTGADGSPAGMPSNALLLDFRGQTSPDKLKPAAGPLPTISVVRYDRVRPYTKDFLCYGIANFDGLWRKGQLAYLCQPSSTSLLEEVAAGFVEGIGAFVQSVGAVIDGVSAVYTKIKSGVVDIVAGAFAELGCGDPCRLAVQLALDAALVSAGVPPSLPDFEQTLADLEKGGVDAVAKVVADAAVSQGIPGPAAELAAKEAVNHLVQEAKTAAAGGGSGGSGFRSADWKPDPNRTYRPGAFVLELRNPFDKPTAEIVLMLAHNNPRHAVVPGVPPGDGVFGRESVDVGGLRPVWRKIPPLAPGTSLRVELALEPIPDPNRWLDLHYEAPLRIGNMSVKMCGKQDTGVFWGCGNCEPPRDRADPRDPRNSEKCKKWCQWRTCLQPFYDQTDAARSAATKLKDAFVDVYGPGNDNFSLKLLPTAGELTIDTSEGTAYVKYPNPTWQDRRVDACLGFTGQCGEPAAQMFCKMMGYPAAVGAQGATDVGPQTTTITLDKKEICTGAHCRALSEITCSTKSMATLRSTGT